MSTGNESRRNLIDLTDCLSFVAGSCAFNKECHYRHCQAAISQSAKCPNWPESCINIMCPYRHPMMQLNVPERPSQEKGSLIFLWDIEKVPVPKGENVSDVVERLRQKFVSEHGLHEAEFSCCCNPTTLSEEDRNNLDRATVRMIHVLRPTPGAIDRKMTFELDRFERQYRPPTTVVLISDNITYLDKIDDLRHNMGFRVIVIQNKSTNRELKAIVDEHYSWTSFTKPSTHPKQQASQQRAGSVLRTRCPSNHTRPSQTIIPPVLILPPSSNTREDDSSRDVPPTIVRQSRTREVNNKHQSNGEKLRRSDACENIPSAVSKYSLPCPFCTNQFNTVEELRQHQTDSNHLFDCAICKKGFSSQTDLREHQKAKKHVFSNKATKKKNIQ